MGVLILLGLQLLQIIVAFIPGEVVQVAAVHRRWPFCSAPPIILLGLRHFRVLLIYTLVHKLGAPFVRAMVDEKHLVKFYEFERSGKLNLIVFVLFLDSRHAESFGVQLYPDPPYQHAHACVLGPSRPWGVFPALLFPRTLLPACAEGDITTSLIIFGIAAVPHDPGHYFFRDKIMSVLGTQRALHKMDKATRGKAGRENPARVSSKQEDEKRVE